MVFSSTEFLFLFLPGLLVLYYFPLKQNRVWRNTILLLFSIGFYAWGEPVFVFLMLLSILVNWGLVLGMERSAQHRKRWLTAVIGFDVLLLGVFKYVSFLSENLTALTGGRTAVVQIALPIGISFFTFQLMSYVFDVYYGVCGVQKNPFYVALYISLFPQLIAGPIVRYRQIEAEITGRTESFSEFAEGVRRFVYGLGKKVLLANFAAQVADNYFDYQISSTVLAAWLGAAAYTLQIYFDFSGYSDMAIGLGRMFGFHFAENFRWPYMAGSVTEFWRRWHISLSTWFRDYVYIPLGGNQTGKRRQVWNLFVVWALTGIWHGANWTFLLWGLIYFVVLLLERRTGWAKKAGPPGHVYTMAVVVTAWVIFRSPDIASGLRYVGRLFGIGVSGFCGAGVLTTLRRTWAVLTAALIGTTPLLSVFFEKLRRRGQVWPEAAWLTLVFILSVLEVVSSTYNPFIYFNF